LYISDQDNHRVLHYSGTSTTADQVYGQPYFTSNSPNNGGVSATSLNTPFDVGIDSSGNLYVADYGNNRVLYFGTVASITASAGSGQSVRVNTTFSTNLVATVRDTLNNPVNSVVVTFTAPLSGASGTFVGGSTVYTSTTNASGLVTATTFTANTIAGSYTVSATVGGVATPASFTLTNTAGTANSLSVVSGNSQSANTNTAFSAPLVAKVLDSYANPISGTTVTFTAPAGGASGTFAGGSATYVGSTDASGMITTTTFSANGVVGSYSVSASASGVAGPAAFSLTNQTGVAATITALSGSGQNTGINTAFSAPQVAQVKDSSNNPISGASVTFTAPASGASGTFVGGSTVYSGTTNASGMVTATTFSANTLAGSYTVTATVSGVATPASFGLSNTAGPASSVSVVSGNNQNTWVNTAFNAPLVAKVTDSSNNPVSGTTVTFTAPASGASASFAGGSATYTGTTNASGIVTTTGLTANDTAGSYTVNATVAGAATPVSYTLTNIGTVQVIVVSGDGQSTPINTAFPQPLVARVLDSNNQPVSGISVAFEAPGAGASGSFAGGSQVYTATTDATGTVTSTLLTAGPIGGQWAVTADLGPSRGVANFSLTNTTQSAASIVVVSGSGQSTAINTNFAQPLVAKVLDSNNQPVSGAAVSFTAPTSGASGFFSTGPITMTSFNGTTDASGLITTGTFVANSIGGSYQVTATVSGVATPASFGLSNTAGPASTVSVVSGNHQSANTNTAFSAPLVVKVTDSYANPVSGTLVTFTAPAGGASGTFAGGNTSYVGSTDASGMVTTTTFSANGVAGSYSVSATVSGVASPAVFSLTNQAGVAATITALSGGGQNASSNTTFAQPLVAQVKDSGNNPVSGVVVTFTAPTSGASGTFAGGSKVYTGTTDSKGRITTATFTANAMTGSYSVSASVSGVGTPTNFALTNQFTGNNRVYGQPDFTSNTSNNSGVTPISLSYPGGLVVDANGGLYISDRNNNRVLHYQTGSTFADRVYGQPDLYSTNNGGINETTLNSPGGVTIDDNGGGIYIADTANNRVLHYPAGSTTADRVYGQGGSFNTNGANNGGLNAASLYNPEGVAVDSSGGLYVADYGNNRVLHYPSGSTTADRVYGQLGSFTSGKYYSTASPDLLINPAGVAVDSSGGLYVADQHNSRVVHYSGTSTTADKVYGQSDLYSNIPNKGGRSASSLYYPTGVMPDGSGGLYIADYSNNRVLHYSGTSTTADKVYGQSDFTSGGSNNGGVSASSLSVPWGVAVDSSGHLYVSDQNNNRALYYGPNPLLATSGSGQSTLVNTAFPTKLVATVLDGNNSPVSSVVVTFTAPGSGASGTFAGGNASYVGTTDVSGMVTTTTFTANSVSGSYSVSATLGGVGSPAAFSLTNVASCNPLVVTSNLDDGSCGTLRTALSTASTGASKQVTITLSAGSVITLTSGLNLATGVSITTTATCTASGPAITIKGTGNNSGNGLTLSSGNSIYGLWVRGFSDKQIVAPSAGGNTLRCVKSTKS
jgi:protocatechuate 3,4-dioxygenase beta subunit